METGLSPFHMGFGGGGAYHTHREGETAAEKRASEGFFSSKKDCCCSGGKYWAQNRIVYSLVIKTNMKLDIHSHILPENWPDLKQVKQSFPQKNIFF